MVECPICRSGSRDSGSICPGCGIPSSLTEVILEIAGPKPEPKLARAMAELLGAAGIAPEHRAPHGITPDRSGALQAAPVPPPVRNAYPAPMPEVGDRSPPPAPIPTRPEGGLVSVEQNIRSIVELGNELGLQAPGLVEEARAALEAGDRPQLAALRRQAFQLVSSALVDEYGKIHAARDRLRSVAPV
ncbi:MAG TPA: hypothetical protein VJS68_04440, partial [Thermoplasmata archaeon]|nr:hypothetical protein [Thermoplasmata archaeon]